MSKLSTILNEVYAKIRDKMPEIISSEHTEVEESVLKAMFDITVFDSEVTQTYTAKNNVAGITYALILRQNGGLVNANLIVKNTTAAARGNEYAFSFKPSDYLPESTGKSIIGTCRENLNYHCEFKLSDTGLFIDGTILKNSTYILNFVYNIKY